MATLTSTKIKNTYDALLKSIDNDAIGTTAKQITDGLGNVTPLYISTTQVGIGVTPEAGLNLHVFGDAKIGSNLTVIGNLVVEGSTTTVGTDTLTVKDPLIVLANNNTSTDAVDIGFYGKYTPSGTTLYSGLFREALTGKYRLFKGLEDEPTTTVNTSGTGYAVATLIASLEGNVTGNVVGNLSGNVTGGSITATTGLFTDNVNIAGTLVIDDELTIEGSAFGRIEIGGASGGYIDLKAPHTDDYDLRIITSSGGNEITTATGDLIFNTAETLALTIDTSQDATFEGDIILAGTVDGRDVATDGAKLDGIEAGADVTDATNVLAAGAVMTTGNQSIAGEKTFSDDFTVTSDAVFNGNINLDDDERIRLGTSNAFQLYYDSTLASGQGGAIIDSNRIFIQTSFFQLNSRTGESMIRATSNSDVELYYDNSKKLETTSTGVTVTGNINIGDNNKILLGDSDDVEMYFDGATQFGIINDTAGGSIFLRSDSFLFRNDTDQFYSLSSTTHTFKSSGTTRLTVNSTGIDVNGNINVSSDLTVDTDTLFVDASEDSVGIGLTNPADYSADELVISVPDDSGMTLVSGTTDTAYITFADGTAAADQANFISHDHNTNTLTVFSQAKVSIGILEAEVAYFTDTNFYVDKSTTIDDTLTVNGNATFGGNITGVRGFFNSGATNVVATFTSTDGTATLQCADSAGNVEFGASGNNFVVQPAGGVAQLTVGASSSTFAGNVTVNNSGDGKITIGGVSGLEIIHNNAGNTIAEIKQLYASTSNSAQMKLTSGFTTFHTGTSGTERMRIDSSGNVGIGTDSPSQKLEVNGAAKWFGATSTDFAQTGGQIDYYDTGRQFRFNAYKADSTGAEIVFNTGGTTSFNQRMVIASNGNVGIGTTSPYTNLEVAGSGLDSIIRLYAGGGTANIRTWEMRAVGVAGEGLLFRQVNDANNSYTNRMIIDTDGNVGIGTISPTGKLNVETTGNHIHIRNSGATAGKYWNLDVASNNRFYILDNGGTGVYIADGATSWTANSDESLKENIKPLENVLDKIKDYRCVEYNLKSDDTKNKKIGFIAQDWVDDFAPIVDKDDEGILGIKYTETIPVLLKAIQELKAEIELLKTQINN